MGEQDFTSSVLKILFDLLDYVPEGIQIFYFDNTLVIVITRLFREIDYHLLHEMGENGMKNSLVKMLSTKKQEFYNLVETFYGKKIKEHFGDVNFKANQVIDVFRF